MRATYEKQRAALLARRDPPPLEARRADLSRLESALQERRRDLARAVDADFGGRSIEETLLLEVFVVLDEIRHARARLKRWMRPRRVQPNWQFMPSSARYVYQPLGVVGIIGAWNYPVLLSLSPLVGALAAGNHVMVKTPEKAPRTSEELRALIEATFPREQVAVIVGDDATGCEFATLPFDHLLFTGSAGAGRSVMRCAAENLVPVTLELGGKCPVIVTDRYRLRQAARRIMQGKLGNAGQTCVAPDYVLVPDRLHDELHSLLRQEAAALYPRLVANRDYTRILSRTHYARLEALVQSAEAAGARVDRINPAAEHCDSENKVFPPTLLSRCPVDSAVLREELFGPVLPLVPYTDIEEAIDFVNARPRPLALYCFGEDMSRVDHIVRRTLSGGVTINGCVYQFPQHNLPFGGVGESGIGAYHGFDGFQTFSKKRGIFVQRRFAPTDLLRPPFGRLAEWLIGTLITNRPQPERMDRDGTSDISRPTSQR